MVVSKRKNGEERRRQYRPVDEERGTNVQRLVDAMQSQGASAGDMMDLLSSMRAGTGESAPVSFRMPDSMLSEEELAARREEQEAAARAEAARTTDDKGRVFIDASGRAMYQPPSGQEGRFMGTGRLPSASDVMTITGGSSQMRPSQERNVAKLLQDPAVMQYFMDIYGEAGRAYKPNTVRLKYGGDRDPKRSTGGAVGHMSDRDPRSTWDPSCKDNDNCE